MQYWIEYQNFIQCWNVEGLQILEYPAVKCCIENTKVSCNEELKIFEYRAVEC